MSQDPQCHNESKNPPGPGTSSAVPDSRVHPFHGDLVKIPDWNTSTTRVKRRKTKKELNNAKFKSHNEIFKKKTFPRGVLQRSNTVGKTVPHSGGKDVCDPRRVFITENRLTHHQGIFNREVKSIDIGRLVSREVGTSKSDTALCTAESVRDTPQSQRSLSLGLLPTPEGKNQEVRVLQKGHSPEIPAERSEPAVCDQQEEDPEKCQSCPQSDDHVIPGSGTTTSPTRDQPAPILETAQSIVNMLKTRSLFPGRNLINEGRQAILEKAKNLREAKTTPSAVQKRPEYNQIGNVSMYKDQGWESVGKGRTDIGNTAPKIQSARRPIQTSPIRFLPIPRDSPAHTLIKMPSPEDHLKLKDILPQPLHYGSDPPYQYQYQQISSQSPRSLINIHSSSNDSKLGQQDITLSSFCRMRRARPMVSSPVNGRSPQVRWRLADDISADFTHNSPSGNIRRALTSQDPNQGRVSRTPLQDIFSQAPSLPRLSVKQQFSHDKTSSDVFWASRDQRSPATKVHDISPASIRWTYRAQSPPRIYTARSQQMAVTGTRGSLGVFPMDSFGESGRETKRHVSSWLEADIGQHCGRFSTNTMPKQQHPLESRRHDCWNPPCFLQENPRHVEYGGVGGIPGKDWPHARSHVEHYVALSPHSVQQEPSFTPCRHSKCSKRASSGSSPATWTYPRMKLY